MVLFRHGGKFAFCTYCMTLDSVALFFADLRSSDGYTPAGRLVVLMYCLCVVLRFLFRPGGKV